MFVSDKFNQELFFKKLFIKKKISMDKNILEKNKDRFIYINEKTQIDEDFYLLPVLHLEQEYICKDSSLYMKNNDKLVEDDFSHEIFINIVNNKSSYIISSCSHNGIVNILKTSKEQFNLPVKSIIAGFHTMGFGLKKLNCSIEYLKEMAKYLNDNCEESIYTFHCTGLDAFKIFQNEIPSKLYYLKTGEKIKY